MAAALPVYIVSTRRIKKLHTNTMSREAIVTAENGSTAFTTSPRPASRQAIMRVIKDRSTAKSTMVERNLENYMRPEEVF